MTMTNAEYWRDRALQRERQAFKLTSEELAREVKFYYETSIAEIQKEIAALYGQFAKENKISLPDARRLIRGKEFRTWRMSLKEYIKASKADPKILRELNTLAMRTRINRLEMLEARTLMVIADLSEKLDDWLAAKLYRSYVEANYGNLYDIGQTAGFYTPPVAVDPKQVEDVIKTPWSGKNYSARIWANGLALSKILRQTVLQNVHRGTSIDKLSRNIAQKMNTAYSNAERLVRTELNYVHNRAAAESIKAADFAEYQFVAVLDARTTPICQSLDGEHFPLAELEVGENAPPMHVRCRSTIIAYDGEPTGKRTARDSDGRRIKIPADMDYFDWKSIYINKERTLEEWQSLKSAETDGRITLKRKSFEEMKDYHGKLTNITVRKWYIYHDENIHNQIDSSLPMEQKARQAFELRNLYRTQARELMADKTARAELEIKYPNKTWEATIADKMKRKDMTREQAIEDVYKTAVKSNREVNQSLGVG